MMNRITKKIRSRLGDLFLTIGYRLKRNNYYHERINFICRKHPHESDTRSYHVREILNGEDNGEKNLQSQESLELRQELLEIKGVRTVMIYPYEIDRNQNFMSNLKLRSLTSSFLIGKNFKINARPELLISLRSF